MARLRGFQKLTSVESALQAFWTALDVRKPSATMVKLDSACGRVLMEPIMACEDLPRVDRSAVDGYAVKAADTIGASQFKPRLFTLTNRSEVDIGQAKQVWTGNPVPKGSDAVVMLENTRQANGRIEVWGALARGENVSKKGEDLKKGELAVDAGFRLKPHHLGLLAAVGIDKVKVFEKPRVAILATGNELVDVGGRRREDQVFDANKYIVSAMCQELGAEPLDLGIVPDDVEAIMVRLKKGLEADAVITTGGTSVGKADLVPDAVNRIGKPGVIVHGVAMRPAMPTALAVVMEKPVVILSGNPVAAMIGFEVFARPLISRLSGMKHEEPRPMVKAQMARKAHSALGRKTFVRVRVFQKHGEFFAEPVSSRGSGIISTMTKSNGYVVVPENREGVAEGETVLVHLFDTIEGSCRSV